MVVAHFWVGDAMEAEASPIGQTDSRLKRKKGRAAAAPQDYRTLDIIVRWLLSKPKELRTSHQNQTQDFRQQFRQTSS